VSQDRQFNILLVAATPFFVDRGGHIHIYEQARALQALGNDVTMVTYHIGKDVPEFPIHRIINLPWYNKTDAGPSYQKPYIAVLLLLKALKVARDIKPNIVHAHGWDSMWVAWWLWKLLGIPFVFDMQGSFSGEIAEHGYSDKGGLYYNFLSVIENLSLKTSPVVMTSSTQIYEQAMQRFKMSPDKLLAILDGVDTAAFSPDNYPYEEELFRQLNLPEDKKIVFFMGLLKQYQGVDDMIEAARGLVYDRGYTDVHFLVVGFPDEDEYAAKAAENGLSEYMTFTGKVPYYETGRYMALADLAIAPKIAITEGDAKIYFYMAMGLPVVAYEREASVEILGDLGLYAKYHDPVDLARALHEALEDDQLLARRGQENREKAVNDYSWEAVARRIMDAYDRAIERQTPERARVEKLNKVEVS
jgi:glycosyltransferase involved in cell wall biosynthesis